MVDISKIESFESGIPADADMPPVSDDPVCEFPGCGAPLFYSGRGRKPKFCDEHKKQAPTARKTGGGTVDAAMASLEFTESLLSIALLMMSPAAAIQWSQSLPELRSKNRAILAGNPQLCKSIAKTSSKVSPFMLLGSYGYALAPVAKTVLNDMNVKKRNREAAETVAPVYAMKDAAPNDIDIDAVIKANA
jgi:hypothetical protein